MCITSPFGPAQENCVNFQAGAKTNRGEANAPGALPATSPTLAPTITQGLLSPSINSQTLLGDGDWGLNLQHHLLLLTDQKSSPESPGGASTSAFKETWVSPL